MPGVDGPPFVEAFGSRLAYARWRLDAFGARLAAALPRHDAARAPGPVLAPAVADALVAGLGRELAGLAAPVLLDRFLRVPGRRFLDPGSAGAYDAYGAALAAGGLEDALDDLPELDRLVTLRTEHWLWRSRQLLHRIETDRELLAWRFGVTLPFTRAASVGDGIVVLGDAVGGRVVYKPRPLDMEASLQGVLAWLAEQGTSLELLTTPTADRGAYGWMAHVPQEPAADAVAQVAYRRRAGMLLALVHLLGGGDVHAGNVRACGAHPVIVDAEVLLRPQPAADAAGLPPDLHATGWLPTHVDGGRCGLAAGLHDGGPGRFVAVGTDAVAQRPLRRVLDAPRAAFLDHVRRHGDAIARDLRAGFREVCELAARRGLPLELFAGACPRVLLRTSSLYQEAIEANLRPARLRSASARATVVDGLVDEVPGALRGAPTGVVARVAAAERASLRAGRVPRFSAPADGRELLVAGVAVGAPFSSSALRRASGRLAALGPAAIDGWCLAIERSLADAARGAPPARQIVLAGAFAPRT